MTFPPALKRTKATVFLCLSLLGTLFPAHAQSAPPSERFLLVVETSAGIKPRATNVIQTVDRLFSTGLNGQVHAGDTIGVWTYDSELHTGKFPLQHWTPQSGRDITLAIVQFLEQQSYDHPSSLASVVAPMTNIVAHSDKITVLLISAGSEAPAGMPFAAQIADAYKLKAATQQERSMPFVTLWRAARGEFAAFTVSTPPGPIVFPAFATNPPPLVPVVTNPPVPNLIVINHDSPPATNRSVETNAVAPTPTRTNEAVAAVTTPAPIVSNLATVPVAKTNPAPASPLEPAAVPTPPKSELPFIPILVGVIVLMTGLVIFCLAKLKRSRASPRASLITRSMDQKEK